MSPIARQVVTLARGFGLLERDQVCCGDVTVPQCVVLQHLLEGPDDVGGLAGVAGSSQSAMTRLVDGMVRRGWVDRTRSEADRRRVLVALTGAGRAQAEGLERLLEDTIDRMMQNVPPEKREQVVESLELISAAIGATRSCCC